MYNILVIGTGQLGRRHIEGLTSSKHELNIFAYDQDLEALHECNKHFNGINPQKNKSLGIETEIKSFKNKSLDLVIVATPATNRPDLLKQYFLNIDSRFWLIEKPISQSSLNLDSLLNRANQGRYFVNHWRRDIELYKKVKAQLPDCASLSIKVSGADLGIACNISHYVDLVNFLTDEIPEKVCTRHLSAKWHPSKRKGFYDINGRFAIEFSGGAILEMDSRSTFKSYEIEIQCNMPSENLTFKIDEMKGTITYQGHLETNLKPPYQSQMSGQVFDDLVNNGTCSLTPLNTAVACHKPVIKALVKHWNSTMTDVATQIIPIT